MGSAYVTFTSPPDALSAYQGLNGTIFQGRRLHLQPAISLRVSSESAELKLKKQRELKKKQLASHGFNWSMLYMNVSSQRPAMTSC